MISVILVWYILPFYLICWCPTARRKLWVSRVLHSWMMIYFGMKMLKSKNASWVLEGEVVFNQIIAVGTWICLKIFFHLWHPNETGWKIWLDMIMQFWVFWANLHPFGISLVNCCGKSLECNLYMYSAVVYHMN